MFKVLRKQLPKRKTSLLIFSIQGHFAKPYTRTLWLEAVDYVFAAVYIAEFCLRLYTYGIPVLRTLDMYSVK